MFQANLAHSCGIAAQRTQCGFSSSRTRSKLPFKSQLHQRFDSEPGEPLEHQPSRWGGQVQTLEAVSPRWLGHRPPCQWGIAFSSSHCDQAKPRITQLCPAHPQRETTQGCSGPDPEHPRFCEQHTQHLFHLPSPDRQGRLMDRASFWGYSTGQTSPSCGLFLLLDD